MMTSNLVPLATTGRRPLNDIHAWAVVALHVQITGCKTRRLPRMQIARNRQRLEKYLGHDDSAAEVEHDTAIVEVGEGRCEAAEIAVAGIANRGSVRSRMLVNYLRADRRVNSTGNGSAPGREHHRELGVRQRRRLERTP